MELLDYRPTKSSDPELEQPEKTRLVLTPNDESRWTDICLMGQKSATPWSDADALQLEAQLLVSEMNGLCHSVSWTPGWMHFGRIETVLTSMSISP